MAAPSRRPHALAPVLARLTRGAGLLGTVAVVSLLVYLLGTRGGLLAPAYSLPVAVAAIRSRGAGLVAAAVSVGGFVLAQELSLTGPSLGIWRDPSGSTPLDPLAAGLALGLALVALALGLAARAGDWQRALDEATAEARRWLAEAGRLEGSAAERIQAHARLEKLLRSRSAPTLQVAHQLRAPVAAIQSCLDVVLQGYADRSPEQQRRLLQSARDSASEMLALTNDVLRLGELREATLNLAREPVDVAGVALRVVEAYRAEALLKSVQLTADVSPGLPPIPARQAHLEELFRNLLDNAIKYNVPGGRLWLKLWLGAGAIRGEVGDTGIGIRERDLPRIFEEFFRADNAKEVITRGTGLGLPIVKQVVELCGGTLEVHSKLGEGTTFSFSLPVVSYQSPAASHQSLAAGRQSEAPNLTSD